MSQNVGIHGGLFIDGNENLRSTKSHPSIGSKNNENSLVPNINPYMSSPWNRSSAGGSSGGPLGGQMCLHCPRVGGSSSFKTPLDFADHLRTFHATREGGSFVCRYGPHNICRTLPLEGVSDADYEKHISKEHVIGLESAAMARSLQRISSASNDSLNVILPNLQTISGPSGSYNEINPDSSIPVWTIADSQVNLPAVLNDPRKSRSEAAVFFTRHWGESFVDRGEVKPSSFLPKITEAHFGDYISRHCKMYRRMCRHLKKMAQAIEAGKQARPETESWRFVLTQIPTVFLDTQFDLSNLATFTSLFLTPDIVSSVTQHQPQVIRGLAREQGDDFDESNPFREEPSPATAIISSTSHLPDFLQSSVNIASSPVAVASTPDPLRLGDQSRHQLRDSQDSLHASNPFNEPEENHLGGTSRAILTRNRLLEEKLSHYLDIVEVQIARQISGQSSAFFHAMAWHDELQVYLAQTKGAVQAMRSKVRSLDGHVVQHSMHMLFLERKRANANRLLAKLRLMDTIRETQGSVQRFLNNYDFLRALELIAATQDVLRREASGMTCFRHLGMQLKELEKMINRMLQDEFVNFIKLELVRLESDENDVLIDASKLTSLVLGLLKLREYRFIEVLKEEISNAVKYLLRDTIREFIQDSDVVTTPEQTNAASLADQMRQLSNDSWITLFKSVLANLYKMCRKVQLIQNMLIDLIRVVSSPASPFDTEDSDRMGPAPSGSRDSSTSPTHTSPVPTAFSHQPSIPAYEDLNGNSLGKLENGMHGITLQACIFSQERCVRVIVVRSRGGFMDRLSRVDLLALCDCVEEFSAQLESLCGKRLTPLRGCLQTQTTKFVNRFHEDKKEKLGNILDSENWRQADVSDRFQQLIDHISHVGKICRPEKLNSTNKKRYLVVDGDKFVLVGTALLFLEIMVDYCEAADGIPTLAPELHIRLIELLKHFNSRACQLVLGAGAVQLVGLRTISTKNLALASRSLQLIIHYIPLVRKHFAKFSTEDSKHLSKHFDTVLKDYQDHVSEIFNKLLAIMSHHMESALTKWELAPPSPSGAFSLICKQLKKLYETIADVLPGDQVQKLFLRIHDSFKDQLRKVLAAHGITTASGASYAFVCSEFSFYMECIRSLPSCASVSESLTEVLLQK